MTSSSVIRLMTSSSVIQLVSSSSKTEGYVPGVGKTGDVIRCHSVGDVIQSHLMQLKGMDLERASQGGAEGVALHLQRLHNACAQGFAVSTSMTGERLMYTWIILPSSIMAFWGAKMQHRCVCDPAHSITHPMTATTTARILQRPQDTGFHITR